MDKCIFWTIAITALILPFNAVAQPQLAMMPPAVALDPMELIMPTAPRMPSMTPMSPEERELRETMLPGAVGGVLNLAFHNPELAQILELTTEQIDDLRTVARESQRELMRIRDESGRQVQEMLARGGIDNETLRRINEPSVERQERVFHEVRTQIDQILLPEQTTMLRDVTFQLSGGLELLSFPSLFQDNMFPLETLDLTDAQREQFREIRAMSGEEHMRAQKEFSLVLNAHGENRPPNVFHLPETEKPWDELTEEERREIVETFQEYVEAIWEEYREEETRLRDRYNTEWEARARRTSEQVTALLTPEQRARAARLSAGIPALLERLGLRPLPPNVWERIVQEQQRQEQLQGGREVWVPGPDSWQPGRPLPGTPSPPHVPSNFPREAN